MRRLPVLLMLPMLVGCLPGGGPIIRVVNADSVTLDRVMIEAGGSEYALGRLLPGTAGQVRPAPPPDSSVAVWHHAGGPFAVSAPFGARPKVVEVRLLADSIGSVRVEAR